MVIIQKLLKLSGLMLLSVLFFFLFFSYFPVNAQEKPPRPVGVFLYQNLSFGAFSQGTMGGTVTISPYGMRYTTGDIVLFTQGWPYFPAIFEIQGNPGTVVHLQVVRLFPPYHDAELTGNNGGLLMLDLGNYIPGDPIIITTNPPARTQVSIGGTLTVSSPIANPPGSYSGIFEVMFIQE